MLTTQKTISIIKHDKNVLPILEYISSRDFTALSISGGVILWLYQGLAALIPAARIANLAATMEGTVRFTRTKSPKIEFTMDDAIILPKLIADALLGDDG